MKKLVLRQTAVVQHFDQNESYSLKQIFVHLICG